MFRIAPRLLNIALQHNCRYFCYNPHLMTNHLAELTVKATRRQFLAKTVLNQNKQVIYAEERKPEDFVLKLKQEGKCPGVIIPNNGRKQDEVDIVLPGKAMRTRRKSPQYGLEKVHVRVGGKEYTCLLKEVRMSVKNYIEKVFLFEYVPGEPNYLKIPVYFSHLQQNRFYNKDYDFEMPENFVYVVSYNHEYPTAFYVDVRYVNPDRPYTFGDLANTFPPGLILNVEHRGMDPKKEIFVIKQMDASSMMGGEKDIKSIMKNIQFSKDLQNKKEGQAGASSTTASSSSTPAKKGK